MSLHRLNSLRCATRCCPLRQSPLYPPSSFYPATKTARTPFQRLSSSAAEPVTKNTTNTTCTAHVKNLSGKQKISANATGKAAVTKAINSLSVKATGKAAVTKTIKSLSAIVENQIKTRKIPVNGTTPVDRSTRDDGIAPYNHPTDAPRKLTTEQSIELSKHMLSLYWTILPSEQDMDRLKTFVSGVKFCMHSKWGDIVDIQVFGSAASDLWMGSDSDVDLSLICRGEKVFERMSVYAMADALRRAKYNRIQTIGAASVPIVKFYDPETKISSDVNIMNKLGIKNTDMLREYSNFDKRIKPFLYLVKWFAKRRNLSTSVTSYCHVMMALHYLQIRNPPIIPSLQKVAEIKGRADWINISRGEYEMGLRRLDHAPNRTVSKITNCAFSVDVRAMEELGFQPDKDSTVAQLLHGFFVYYGHYFDFDNDVVSLRLGRRASKKELCFEKDALAVEDPFLLWKNLLGQADYRVRDRLQREYRRAADLLSTKPTAEALENVMDLIEPSASK